MKKSIIYFSVVALLFTGISSCKKDKSVAAAPQYSMDFTISASSSPLYFNRIVTNEPLHYYLKQCDFYVGYPSLVKTDGTLVPLTDVFIVALDSSIGYTNVYGRNFSFTVPAGSYKGVSFGIGMPRQISDTVTHYHWNASDPLDGNYGMVWNMVNPPNIFRNIMLELVVDTSKSQKAGVNRDYQFHILEDDTNLNLYKTVMYPDAFTVGNGDNHTTTFNLDFNNIFFNNANPINLVNIVGTDMTISHPYQPSEVPGLIVGEAINTNFYSSLSVKQ